MTEYQNGVSFIYSAFFENDTNKSDNIGNPLIFSISTDISS